MAENTLEGSSLKDFGGTRTRKSTPVASCTRGFAEPANRMERNGAMNAPSRLERCLIRAFISRLCTIASLSEPANALALGR